MNKIKHNHKHNNQVRIIGGTHRGRKITFQSADGLRPTPDSVREKLFNWLGQDLTGRSVLDLFSGSGVLGLEAASRNAKQVVLVENNRQTAATLKQNAKLMDMQQVQVVLSDGLYYLSGMAGQFDVVFLDPPFAWQQWSQLWQLLKGHLKEGAMVYIEAGQLPKKPVGFKVYREGKAGKSLFELLIYSQAAEI